MREDSTSVVSTELPFEARLRPRLSRTLARARWREYRRLLEQASERGYEVLGVEQWLGGAGSGQGPLLILRHDVDQHPRSALAMARVERELGIRSSWYFRWRTADPGVIAALRGQGCAVGFHYETLSRLALERGVADPAAIAALVPEARRRLGAEIDLFARLHGPLRSICPHGDSRIGLVRNASLVEAVGAAGLGVEFDANEAMRGRGLGHWLTDRSLGEGGWADGPRPAELFDGGVSPILCVVHPNNWSSGPSLWLDRALAAALPVANGGRLRRPLRTGVDAPPA